MSAALALITAAVLLPPFPSHGSEEAVGEVTLSLDEALATSLANNLDLANASLEVSKAEKTRAIAGRGRLPEVDLDSTFVRVELPDREKPPLPGIEIPETEADTALTASMPLYTGGRLSSAERQAEAGVALAREAERGIRLDLLFETAAAFYELLTSQEFVSIAREALEGSLRHLGDVEMLLAEGVVAKVDLYRTELDLAERERDLAGAEANLVRRAEHLSSLLYPEAFTVPRARGGIPEPEEPAPVERWYALALESSPEVLSSDLSLGLAREGIAAAKAERLPALGLFGALGARGEDYSYRSEDRYWHAGVSFALPVYRGRRTLLDIERSRDSEGQAANSTVQVRRLVRRGIVDAHAGTVLALRQAEAAAKAITAAEENLRVTKLKYGEGIVTNTDVIDALLSLSRARFDRVDSLKNYFVNRALLMRLSGTISELLQ